ncbi:hypothetical protein TNIN_263851 [Trichonephila inaurata madagascariensis]|uniref:Uncharacterized protein n=1 Tax=Trichonephila inaurata madagascariensis TaxID=2747483 RepID=A0A8X6WVV8_9ARAC|nr:hypothetical protein TNIN_288481 [Trichonephila inaurata madagascariensis]GFY46686.1 hypothetical protein TNIN_263851 [Trichonephila inaurata madagascariensis]
MDPVARIVAIAGIVRNATYETVMDSDSLGEVGTPLQLGDKIRFRACALSPYHIAVVWKRDKMEFEQEIVQKNYFVSQLQEFYPYCVLKRINPHPKRLC